MSAGTYSAAVLRPIKLDDVAALPILRGWLSKPAATELARVSFRDDDSSGASEVLLSTREQLVNYPTR